MAKSQYLNFNEYKNNDKNYFLKALKGDLFKPQAKIEFRDGSTYHVTKSGSRYWQRGNYMHREDGPSSVYESWQGGVTEYYYLFSVGFLNEQEHALAVQRLNFLREQSNNELESLVEEIALHSPWEERQKLWRGILQGSKDSTALLASLRKLSKEYQKANKMAQKFITDFS